MYKVDIPLDTKESAAIQARKNKEAARKSRIFDARQRTIGVDLAAIDEQVQQRKNKEADENRCHEAYAAMLIRNDTTAQLMDARNARTQDQIQRNIVEFRAREQNPENRREFDLNDPNGLKKACPLGANDHGISSLQSFVGEDIYNTDRTKHQKEQIREWSLQLQGERQAANEDAAMQDRIYDLKRIQLDNKAQHLEASENNERQAEIDAIKEFNQRAAEQKRLEQESMKNSELANNAQEIRNQILGDTLTENPDVARSAFGPHRVIPDRWKGMSDAELCDIRQLQESQRRENVAKLEAEMEREQEWSLHQTSTAKAGILMERAQNRQSAEERKQLDLENAELARQQQAKRKTMDQVYTNVPTDGYYAQFNTTTR